MLNMTSDSDSLSELLNQSEEMEEEVHNPLRV